MADLDDFFAKKDRKKSKSVKKFATTDEVAKKLEDPKQKNEVRPKKERPPQEGEESHHKKEEEEWKEYEEPVKDYTGLKIQVLQGGTGAQGQQQDSGTDEASNDGQNKPKGPWNKPQPQPAAPQPEPEPVPAPAPEPPVKASVYVPPVPAASRLRPIEPTRRNQAKHAPDIHNDDYFPVLGAPGGGKKPVGWSTAGGGGGAGAVARAPPAAQRPQLALGNRFNALPDDS